MGCVPPVAGYLDLLRDLTKRSGTVLIFDEVMTGFRVAAGGAQQRYGIQPDMTTLGKIIGGGLPVGAYGGKSEIMNRKWPAISAGPRGGPERAFLCGFGSCFAPLREILSSQRGSRKGAERIERRKVKLRHRRSYFEYCSVS